MFVCGLHTYIIIHTYVLITRYNSFFFLNVNLEFGTISPIIRAYMVGVARGMGPPLPAIAVVMTTHNWIT